MFGDIVLNDESNESKQAWFTGMEIKNNQYISLNCLLLSVFLTKGLLCTLSLKWPFHLFWILFGSELNDLSFDSFDSPLHSELHLSQGQSGTINQARNLGPGHTHYIYNMHSCFKKKGHFEQMSFISCVIAYCAGSELWTFPFNAHACALWWNYH